VRFVKNIVWIAARHPSASATAKGIVAIIRLAKLSTIATRFVTAFATNAGFLAVHAEMTLAFLAKEEVFAPVRAVCTTALVADDEIVVFRFLAVWQVTDSTSNESYALCAPYAVYFLAREAVGTIIIAKFLAYWLFANTTMPKRLLPGQTVATSTSSQSTCEPNTVWTLGVLANRALKPCPVTWTKVARQPVMFWKRFDLHEAFYGISMQKV
jgi:hypothetical protein